MAVLEAKVAAWLYITLCFSASVVSQLSRKQAIRSAVRRSSRASSEAAEPTARLHPRVTPLTALKIATHASSCASQGSVSKLRSVE